LNVRHALCHWNGIEAVALQRPGEHWRVFDVAMKSDAPLAELSYRSGRVGLRQNVNKSPDRLKPLRDLYEGESIRAHQFRYGLLVFDLVTIAFIVVTSFLPRGLIVEALDVGLVSSFLPISWLA
jgi:hypothetical protein